jgi:hypothetical protein
VRCLSNSLLKLTCSVIACCHGTQRFFCDCRTIERWYHISCLCTLCYNRFWPHSHDQIEISWNYTAVRICLYYKRNNLCNISLFSVVLSLKTVYLQSCFIFFVGGGGWLGKVSHPRTCTLPTHASFISERITSNCTSRLATICFVT